MLIKYKHIKSILIANSDKLFTSLKRTRKQTSLFTGSFIPFIIIRKDLKEDTPIIGVSSDWSPIFLTS